MPTNQLTDARCKGVKPAEKPAKIFDGGGLFLYVSPKSAKIWRLAYRVDGKPQTLVIGPYPEVGPAEARQKREEAKARLWDGKTPGPQKKRATLTFEQASVEYWAGRKDLSSSYLANATRALGHHLFPAIGSLPVGSVTRQQLLDALLVMDAKGWLHDYVRKTRMWANQVF